jgi:hypothetical protein
VFSRKTCHFSYDRFCELGSFLRDFGQFGSGSYVVFWSGLNLFLFNAIEKVPEGRDWEEKGMMLVDLKKRVAQISENLALFESFGRVISSL